MQCSVALTDTELMQTSVGIVDGSLQFAEIHRRQGLGAVNQLQRRRVRQGERPEERGRKEQEMEGERAPPTSCNPLATSHNLQ